MDIFTKKGKSISEYCIKIIFPKCQNIFQLFWKICILIVNMINSFDVDRAITERAGNYKNEDNYRTSVITYCTLFLKSNGLVHMLFLTKLWAQNCNGKLIGSGAGQIRI